MSCAAFLAAVFLVFDARRMLDETLERYFAAAGDRQRRRHGRSCAIAGLFVVRGDAPYLFHGLLHAGLPLVHRLSGSAAAPSSCSSLGGSPRHARARGRARW